MSSNPQSDPLDEVMSHLPATRASVGFTDRVMGALDERSDRRTSPGIRWAIAAAAVAAILLLTIVPGRIERQQRQRAIAAQAETIRLQHEELLEELAVLRAMADESAPVIYVGGDEDLDLVLDLRPWLADGERTGVAPASYSAEGRRQFYR